MRGLARRSCAGVPDSSKELSVPAQCWLRLHPVLTVQDRVQEQRMDTGLGTLSKGPLDSLVKSIYTPTDRVENQLPCAQRV